MTPEENTAKRCILEIPETRIIPNQIESTIIPEPKSGCNNIKIRGKRV